jgi:hypothetical protein
MRAMCDDANTDSAHTASVMTKIRLEIDFIEGTIRRIFHAEIQLYKLVTVMSVGNRFA